MLMMMKFHVSRITRGYALPEFVWNQEAFTENQCGDVDVEMQENTPQHLPSSPTCLAAGLDPYSMATSRLMTVAATQRSCSSMSSENVDASEALVRRAAAAGAQVILLQELFATQYFCQEQREQHFLLAESESDSPLLKRFQALAKELQVVSQSHTMFTDRCYCCCCCW